LHPSAALYQRVVAVKPAIWLQFSKLLLYLCA
jgi:hypothetical protein